jgi:N-acetylmuramoyl-L-alanine amidase
MSGVRAGLAVLTLVAALGCRREPVSRIGRDTAGADLEEVRRRTAACPVPLTDAALDDLATYERCSLPRAVARLVRNDYADDELRVPDLGVLRRHAGALPRSIFEAQLRRFVDPGGALAGTLVIDEARQALRPDPVLAPDVEVPFAPEPPPQPGLCAGPRCAGRLVASPRPDRPYRAERRAELLALADRARPLAGVRVGLDPGHSGGPFAGLEERRLALSAGDPPRALVIQEGDLTLRTALELRAKLAARGAQVDLTRDRPDLVHPYPLHALRPAAERLLARIALDPGFAALDGALAPAERSRLRSALAVFAVRKQSRFESLRWRARRLSGSRPDLVLSIHYNASPDPGREPVAQEVVVMVRGFHEEGRLYNPYHRWRALEEAFAVDDFDASAHLGALCVRAMAERLGVAVAREERYRDHLPVRDAAGRPIGVDAWNGALLRELDGVAVLAEGPFMDDAAELQRLDAALAAPLGTPGTRTERYADALASCVEGFVRRWTGSAANPFSADP